MVEGHLGGVPRSNMAPPSPIDGDLMEVRKILEVGQQGPLRIPEFSSGTWVGLGLSPLSIQNGPSDDHQQVDRLMQ